MHMAEAQQALKQILHTMAVGVPDIDAQDGTLPVNRNSLLG